MLVKDVMTRGAFTCHPYDSLAHVAQIMWDHDCGCVPVVDSAGKVTAMITDRDVCMAAYMQGRPIAEISVESAASRSLVSVQENEAIDTAEGRMAAAQVRRLPVVDHSGLPVGVLSLSDLTSAKAALPPNHAGRVVQTLAAISAPPTATA
jgi:CBS domain-containing protein